MKVLTAYKRLVESAIEKFCDLSAASISRRCAARRPLMNSSSLRIKLDGPAHQRTSDETCRDLHALSESAMKGLNLDDRNNVILETLRERAEEAHSETHNGVAIEQSADLTIVGTEVQELRKHVQALEERLMQPAASASSSATLIGEYTAASNLTT
jgi:hypothetical protein